MMIVSLCGTPGVGKTTVSEILRKEGVLVDDLTAALTGSGLFTRDSNDPELLVDMELARGFLKERYNLSRGITLIEGHLSYLAPWDLCIVMRLHPKILESRISDRGYTKEKVRENFEAEIVGAILVEAMEEKDSRGFGEIIEIDCTGMVAGDIAGIVAECIEHLRAKRLNKLHQYLPGNVDWLEVSEEWS